MANTYKLITSSTVGAGGASSVTFSSIPSTYTDLKLVISAQNTSTANNDASNMFMTVNGLTASYSNKFLYGSATTTTAGNNSNNLTDKTFVGGYPVVGSSAWSNIEIYIPNYTNSSAKCYSADTAAEINSTTLYQATLSLITGYLPTSSAITTITLIAINNAISQGSTFYLYGINNS